MTPLRDDVRCAVLLDTNPLVEASDLKARRLTQMTAVRNRGLANVVRDEMKPNYSGPGPNRGDTLDLGLEMALGHGPDVFLNRSPALMHRLDQSEPLKGANLPVLVLRGRDDRFCPVSRHKRMTDLIPGAQLEIYEGAEHLPTLEQPELTYAALARWMED